MSDSFMDFFMYFCDANSYRQWWRSGYLRSSRYSRSRYSSLRNSRYSTTNNAELNNARYLNADDLDDNVFTVSDNDKNDNVLDYARFLKQHKDYDNHINNVLRTSDKKNITNLKTTKYKLLMERHKYLLSPADRLHDTERHFSETDAEPVWHCNRQQFGNHQRTSNLTQKTKTNLTKPIKIIIGKCPRPLKVNVKENVFLPYEPENVCVDQLLGQGHFSDVYMAREVSTSNVFALKILSKKQIQENGQSDQVSKQIKIHSKLQHPNIVQLYGYYHDQVNIYITFEYIVDGNLRTHLENSPTKRLDIFNILICVKALGNALIYLRDHNIIHRNLMPENVLVTSNFKIKLSGFGSSTYGPTATGMIVCDTLNYLSPEMITNELYTRQVDKWSLGVLTYELLIGKPPFLSNNDAETRKKIIQGTRNLKFPNGFPIRAKHFICQLMQRTPDSRMRLKLIANHPFTWKC